jgi:hypothetical protein
MKFVKTLQINTMPKHYILLFTVFFYTNLFGQLKTTFAFSTTYNQAVYTQEIEVVSSLEKALLTPDTITAVKISANSKKLNEITTLKNLSYIYLDETFTSVSFYLTKEKMEQFFQKIAEMSSVNYLSIYDSKLLQYHAYLQNIKGLKINKLDDFNDHPQLLKLPLLEVLIIKDPIVNYLPSTIGKLKNLKQLELYTTDVLYFPEVDQLSQLIVFKANIGKITQLHPSLTQLKNLHYLSINGLTNFKNFPEEICQLTSLEELHIELRNAQPLPESIGLLINLKVFHLNDCQKIYEFPSSFSQLTKLSEIYLGDAPEHIQLTNLALLPSKFTLILNRCNYLGIAKQLNTIPKLKQLIVPTTILPKELKKLQETIMAEKVIVQQL